jgi:serine/threonine protein kinase
VLDSITDGSAGATIARGRYVLGPRLGGGGASDVYRAVDTVLERPVAVKLFRGCADPTAECRFQDEARLLAPLVHPAVVAIYDTGVDNGRPYQVLQLVEGRTLRERLADGPLDPQHVVGIGAQLAAALDYVHSHDIVHRDVKPSNILDDGERVYLADFGISRLLNGAHLTASGLAVGTAAYMAPEQVNGHDVGPPADVYSLGLVLLECLTGQQEYPGSAMEAAIARLSRPPLISTRFPAPLPSLLAAMTNDDPDQRPSADVCAAMLRDGVHGSAVALANPAPIQGGADSTAEIPVPVPPPSAGRARNLVRGGLAMLALVLTLLIASAALMTDETPAPPTNSPAPNTGTTTKPGSRPDATGNSAPVRSPSGRPSAAVPGAPATTALPEPTTASPSAIPSPSATPSPSSDPDSGDDDSDGPGDGGKRKHPKSVG